MKKLGFSNCVAQSGELELTNIKENPNDQPKKLTFFQNLNVYFTEFCNGGSMHGFRYISENRTYVEKLLWLVSMIASLYYCAVLVLTAYERWQTAPVMVSFATKETPTWQVPFPTVTICPEAKSRPRIFNYTKYLHKKQDNITLNPEDEKKLGYLSFICDNSLKFDSSTNKFADADLIEFYEQVQPNFYDTISECKYEGKKYNCRELFSPVITDEGICYTFNLLDRTQLFSKEVIHYKDFHQTSITNDWSLEDGYSSTAGIKAYPRRALFVGIQFALEAKFTVYDEDMDYACGKSVKGFKVQISHPQRMPRVHKQHFVLPVDTSVMAAIELNMITTSQVVKKYPSKIRKCVLASDDRRLKYFKFYSQNNCHIECRTNYTLEKCKCVNFYMPREKGTPYCGPRNLECVKAVEYELLQKLMEKKINKVNQRDEGDDVINCQCYSLCNSMNYRVETSQAAWNWRQIYKFNRKRGNTTNKSKHMSLLQVFFKDYQFITLERDEFKSWIDFIADVGGLLGLFIGFSVLTIVEIVYFLGLRIIFNVMLYGRGNWSGRIE